MARESNPQPPLRPANNRREQANANPSAPMNVRPAPPPPPPKIPR